MGRKYEKYVISEPKHVWNTFNTRINYPFDAYLNPGVVPGCTVSADIYWRKKIAEINPVIPWHSHNRPMLLFFAGDPGSFEVEVPLNDEVYKIDKTTAIWVPAGVKHMVNYKRIDRPMCEIGVILGRSFLTESYEKLSRGKALEKKQLRK